MVFNDEIKAYYVSIVLLFGERGEGVSKVVEMRMGKRAYS